MTATARRAEVVLPAASSPKATGTLVNMEGRAQRYFQNFDPAYYDRSIETLEAWRWLGRMRGGAATNPRTSTMCWRELEAELPQFQGVADAAPGAKFRVHGHGSCACAAPPVRPHRRARHRVRARTARDDRTRHAAELLDGGLRRRRAGRSSAGTAAVCVGAGLELAAGVEQVSNGSRRRAARRRSRRAPVRCERPVDAALFRADAAASQRRHERQRTHADRRCTNTSAPKNCRASRRRFRRAAPKSYVVFNALDAQRLGFDDQRVARITIGGVTANLVVRMRNDFPRNSIGVPVGMPGVPPFEPTTPCSVAKGA